eukprot:Nitzschia sp. Nitz4//scaffold243_size29414//1160//2781//NITZ4_008057-RA/size29414-snap-gene-0.0-mRNA-1//1//CDS//3329543834//5109//frame0
MVELQDGPSSSPPKRKHQRARPRISPRPRPRPRPRARRKAYWTLEIALYGLLFIVAITAGIVHWLVVLQDDVADVRSPPVWMTEKNSKNSNNSNNNHDDDDRQPLYDILALAGRTHLTESERQSLPTWSQVVVKFGSEPRMIGLETCATFREQVPLPFRHLAPAGMFSTGTNLLADLMQTNCILPPPRNHGGEVPKKGKNMDWQANWGKHQSPRFRLSNYVKEGRNNSQILPMVLVRDPWTWFQSMCKARYSAHWYHIVPLHCPNFIPNHVEYEWFNVTKQALRKYYDNDPWKVDNVWDKANFSLDSPTIPNATSEMETAKFPFPRILIRLEDVVFFPQIVLPALCDCAGGQTVHPLTLQADTSKPGLENIHGKDKTDLIRAMQLHTLTNRTQGMTLEDIAYAKRTLHPGLMQAFGYKDPTATTTAAAATATTMS